MLGWAFPTVTGLGLLVFLLGALRFLRTPSRRNPTVMLVGGGVFFLPWLLFLASGLLTPFFGKG